jgi:molybdenum cofactor cytidylyltransferase
MSVAAVLLAAGRSTRFGPGDKLVAPLGDIPLGGHVARTLTGLGFAERIAVVGPNSIAWPGFRTVVNDRPQDGLSHSLALGVAAARVLGAEAVLVALADMPFVTATHVAALMARHRNAASRIATSDGRRRLPPALFGSDWFAELETLGGDVGARALLASAETVATAPEALIDIDTMAQLVAARRQLHLD